MSTNLDIGWMKQLFYFFFLNGALIPEAETEEKNRNLITRTTDLAIQSVKAR